MHSRQDAQVPVVLGILQKPIVPSLTPKKRGRPEGSKDRHTQRKMAKAADRGVGQSGRAAIMSLGIAHCVRKLCIK